MLALVLDGLVIILLVATIAYCAVLNKRLGHLRRSEQHMRDMIESFDASARRAETSIESLRQTAASTEDTLHDRIRDAKALSDELQFMIQNADSLTARLDSPSSKPSNAGDYQSAPAPQGDALEASVKSRAERELLKALKSGG